jgi:excisionase family DNA binding protein
MSTTTDAPLGVKEMIAQFGRALTAKELASITSMDKETIYYHARKGAIPSFRIGSSVRFDPKALCEWYDSQ